MHRYLWNFQYSLKFGITPFSKIYECFTIELSEEIIKFRKYLSKGPEFCWCWAIVWTPRLQHWDKYQKHFHYHHMPCVQHVYTTSHVYNMCTLHPCLQHVYTIYHVYRMCTLHDMCTTCVHYMPCVQHVYTTSHVNNMCTLHPMCRTIQIS